MPFDLRHFATLRPHLYHLTDAANIERIAVKRKLDCAAELMRAAGNVTFLRQKRRVHLRLTVDGSVIIIRDQAPLHPGNTAPQRGWGFAEVVEALNERVFFWPGKAAGPNDYGTRHFERYLDENPVIIRATTAALFECDGNVAPEFCKYNSGSPRCNNGRPSPRGPETFVTADNAPFRASEVVEVTFPRRVVLPRGCVEYCHLSDWGNWQQIA